MAAAKSKSKNVGVDDDATPLHEPVTVVVSPAGNHYDADTWSDANNLLAMGYAVAEGYPTGPLQTPRDTDTPTAPPTAAARPDGAGTGA